LEVTGNVGGARERGSQGVSTRKRGAIHRSLLAWASPLRGRILALRGAHDFPSFNPLQFVDAFSPPAHPCYTHVKRRLACCWLAHASVGASTASPPTGLSWLRHRARFAVSAIRLPSLAQDPPAHPSDAAISPAPPQKNRPPRLLQANGRPRFPTLLMRFLRECVTPEGRMASHTHAIYRIRSQASWRTTRKTRGAFQIQRSTP
jgi:hypothetical protein